MRGADLRFTDLGKTNLYRVDLEGAALDGSKWMRTVVCAVDLSKVTGLGCAHHFGPSHLDAETLVRSARALPESFLQGAGITEALVRHLRVAVDPEVAWRSCFVSYSQDTRGFVLRLLRAFKECGVRSWTYDEQMIPGEGILETIATVINEHDKLLLCCSRTSLSRWWVKAEIEMAIERERREGIRLIVPIRLDDDECLPATLRSLVTSRYTVDFRGWESDEATFQLGMERLLKALRNTAVH